jgi:O-methyltransferase
MSAKTGVNAVLTRLTGHHLAKGAPGAHLADIERQLEDTRRELQQARRKQAKPKAAKKPAAPAEQKGDGFPTDYDPAAKDIITAVRPYTMTNNEKLYGLIQATRYIVRNKIPGDIVECGVWRGGSMQAAARTLLEVGDTSRALYLFDTFEGMTEPTEHDVRRDGRPAAELMEVKDKSTWLWAIASLDDVKAGFEQVPYPGDKLHYAVGKVEDTIPAELPERIAILRLDTDWYESTKHELEHAYSRLSPGGILIIDDYAHWEGSKKATDDFVAALDEPLLLHRLGGGRLAVKPFTRPA